METEILELPGHGRTRIGNHKFSIEGFAQWLKDEMDRRKLWENPFLAFQWADI